MMPISAFSLHLAVITWADGHQLGGQPVQCPPPRIHGGLCGPDVKVGNSDTDLSTCHHLQAPRGTPLRSLGSYVAFL